MSDHVYSPAFSVSDLASEEPSSKAATPVSNNSDFTTPLKKRGTGSIQRRGGAPPIAQRRSKFASMASHSAHPPDSTNLPAQDELKKRVKEELRVSTFEDTSLLERLYPLEDGEVEAVLAALDLDNTPIESPNASTAHAHLPQKKGPETRYYQPFADLVNEIRAAHYAQYPQLTSQGANLQSYAKQVDDSVDGAHPLQPDLVFPNSSNSNASASTSSYRWRELDIVGEVKKSWEDLVAQGGTYGRALLNAHPARSFSLVLAFNHFTFEVRFLFFHRGGLHSTPAYDLCDPDGLRGFVHGIICTLALLDGRVPWNFSNTNADRLERWSRRSPPLSPPPSPSPSKTQMMPFRAITYLHRRTSLIGRCTAGWLLALEGSDEYKEHVAALAAKHDKELPQKLEEPEDDDGTLAAGTSTQKRKRASNATSTSNKKAKTSQTRQPRQQSSQDLVIEIDAQDEALATWQKLAPQDWDAWQVEGEEPPTRLFAKDAWAPVHRCREPEYLGKMSNEFGAPKLWKYQELDSNEFFFNAPNATTPWYIFFKKGEDKPKFYENRLRHLVMYFIAIGVPLHQSKTPYELLVSIFHAMLAHYALYKKQKTVHRDISCNNIMRLPISEKRKPPESPDDEELEGYLSTLVDCEGILIDADQARQVGEEVMEGKTVSGTWPFVATRLLKNVANDFSIEMAHTPIDDMESSAWVVLWEFYGQGHKGLSTPQRNWFNGLGSDDLNVIWAQKSDIMLSSGDALPQCPPANQFVDSVLHMVHKISRQPTIGEEDIQKCYRDYFNEFAKCVCSKHPTLHQDWITVFGIATQD